MNQNPFFGALHLKWLWSTSVGLLYFQCLNNDEFVDQSQESVFLCVHFQPLGCNLSRIRAIKIKFRYNFNGINNEVNHSDAIWTISTMKIRFDQRQQFRRHVKKNQQLGCNLSITNINRETINWKGHTAISTPVINSNSMVKKISVFPVHCHAQP